MTDATPRPELPELPDDVPPVVAARPLVGGDVARAWRAELADGRDVVVKATPYDARLEAEGLVALGRAGAPVPAVVGVTPDVLVVDHVTGPPDLRGLGRALAGVHGHHGPGFGWHRDNVIGPLPQANAWCASSGELVVERRLWPRLGVLPAEVGRRLAAACDGGALAALLDEHDPAPGLVHGDLWSGNVVAGRWLIDPAVHHADRETDLAMLALFGTVPAELQRGYDEVAPLPAGWERRRGLLQLPPLLVHVALFGASYVPPIVRRLDEAGL